MVLSTVVEGLGTQRMTSMRGDVKFIACPLERISIYGPRCPIQSLLSPFSIPVVPRSFSIAINNVTYSWVLPTLLLLHCILAQSLTYLMNSLGVRTHESLCPQEGFLPRLVWEVRASLEHAHTNAIILCLIRESRRKPAWLHCSETDPLDMRPKHIWISL